jgi:hypothetical protein
MTSIYGKDATDAAQSVLAELFCLLGEYEKDIVLVGGWVPYFHTRDALGRSGHIGSADVDVAVDIAALNETVYERIVDILLKRGYREHKDEKGRRVPFRYDRDVEVSPGRPVTVWVDFLAPEYVEGGRGKSHRHQRKQDLAALKAPGIELALQDTVSCTFHTPLPNKTEREVTVRMAGAASCIAMKSLAFARRHKPKDAYDLYWLCHHHPEGIPGLAKALRPWRANRVMQKALKELRRDFESLYAPGPAAVHSFMLEHGFGSVDRDIVLRSAYENINSLLDELKIGTMDLP